MTRYQRLMSRLSVLYVFVGGDDGRWSEVPELMRRPSLSRPRPAGKGCAAGQAGYDAGVGEAPRCLAGRVISG